MRIFIITGFIVTLLGGLAFFYLKPLSKKPFPNDGKHAAELFLSNIRSGDFEAAIAQTTLPLELTKLSVSDPQGWCETLSEEKESLSSEAELFTIFKKIQSRLSEVEYSDVITLGEENVGIFNDDPCEGGYTMSITPEGEIKRLNLRNEPL